MQRHGARMAQIAVRARHLLQHVGEILGAGEGLCIVAHIVHAQHIGGGLCPGVGQVGIVHQHVEDLAELAGDPQIEGLRGTLADGAHPRLHQVADLGAEEADRAGQGHGLGHDVVGAARMDLGDRQNGLIQRRDIVYLQRRIRVIRKPSPRSWAAAFRWRPIAPRYRKCSTRH